MHARDIIEANFHFGRQSRERQLGQALQNASEQGLDIVVKMLLDAGADVHYNNDYPIFAAVARGSDNVKVIKMLVAAGADISNLTAEQHKKLGLSHGDYKTAAQHQLKKGYTAETRVLGGPTTRSYEHQLAVALKDACKANSIDVVRLLLKHGASTDMRQWDPISWAIESNNWEMFQLLVDSGADLNVPRGRRNYRTGPLRTAVWKLRHNPSSESQAMVTYLLDHGADMSSLSAEDLETVKLIASKKHYVGTAKRQLSLERPQ